MVFTEDGVTFGTSRKCASVKILTFNGALRIVHTEILLHMGNHNCKRIERHAPTASGSPGNHAVSQKQ
jgi:hypothetical protein